MKFDFEKIIDRVGKNPVFKADAVGINTSKLDYWK